ncbi:MAG: SMC-Scp complex subunit ScpB [Nitrospirota bacterium]
MDDRELKPIVEALLFVAAEPMPINKLCEILEGVERERVAACLDDLREQYRQGDHGFTVAEVAGGYQLVTLPEAAPWLRKLSAAKAPPRLSKPALETLAIIAYKQPLTRPEVESIRGVDVAGVVKTLMDRRLVKIVGRKDVPGRPMMFGTTKEFLHAFGLKDLADLPTLKDFADIARATDASVGDQDVAGSGSAAGEAETSNAPPDFEAGVEFADAPVPDAPPEPSLA